MYARIIVQWTQRRHLYISPSIAGYILSCLVGLVLNQSRFCLVCLHHTLDLRVTVTSQILLLRSCNAACTVQIMLPYSFSNATNLAPWYRGAQRPSTVPIEPTTRSLGATCVHSHRSPYRSHRGSRLRRIFVSARLPRKWIGFYLGCVIEYDSCISSLGSLGV